MRYIDKRLLSQSNLSATMGSTRAARRAGT